MKKDARVDAYIEKSAEFAQPILLKLRSMVHQYSPDAEETIKWGFPNFMYQGRILCNMAAFKQHCAFGFWLGDKVIEPGKGKQSGAMGDLGKITRLSDLPTATQMKTWMQKAMKLATQGEVTTARSKAQKPVKLPDMPEAFAARLAKNKKAKTTFDNFPPSHKKEYLEWIIEAKREETRDKRIAQTIEWLAEGKPRNWKYM